MAQTYLNAKQERFAQFVAEGHTQAEAYVLAGYEPSAANASTLANKPIVKERIEKLKTEHERKEMEFKLLAQKAENADPEFAAAIMQGVQWDFQRIMDMMGQNVRMAQAAGEYKSANECLKMMAECMGMYDKALSKVNEDKDNSGPIALMGRITHVMETAGNQMTAPMLEDQDMEPTNPLQPRKK